MQSRLPPFLALRSDDGDGLFLRVVAVVEGGGGGLPASDEMNITDSWVLIVCDIMFIVLMWAYAGCGYERHQSLSTRFFA
jgi:hypothetical protein